MLFTKNILSGLALFLSASTNVMVAASPVAAVETSARPH